MSVGGGRQQLRLELKTARSQVLEAASGISEDRASMPASGGWSVKDHLNHLTFCDELRFHEISRISRGGRPAYPPIDDDSMDSLNQITIALRRTLPLDQVLADMEFARSLVLEAVAGAPDSALDEAAYGEFGLRGSIAHDLEHAAAIRKTRQGEGR